MNYTIKEERLTAEEYIEFLKHTDLGSQYPKERFRQRIGTLVSRASISLVARNEALYNDIKTYGVTRLFDNSHDLIEVTDFTKSPHQDSGDWFNEKWTIGDVI